jgi:hypothetical protein
MDICPAKLAMFSAQAPASATSASSAYVPPPKPEPDYSKFTGVDGLDTIIPTTEVNESSQTAFMCKYGCKTPTGLPKRFLSKKTFIEHIIVSHPRVRLVLETPPNAELGTQGTRHVLRDMDPDGK